MNIILTHHKILVLNKKLYTTLLNNSNALDLLFYYEVSKKN